MLFILMAGFHGIQAFEVDDNYYYILEGLEVYKNGDDLYVGEFRLHENKFPKTGSKVHEKKSFSKDILVAQDGWYELEFIGRKIPIIFGGNYFTYHDPQDPNSSVYNADEQFYEEAKKSLTGRAIKGGIDYSVFCGMRTRQISSIKVPDVLEENLGGKKIVYDTADMQEYYILGAEGEVYFDTHAKPWATSKNPVGMTVEMEFNSRQHQIVILNGYVNPLKRHLYKENRRIKRIRVSGTSESKGNFSFEEEIEDVVHFHQIDIPARTSEVEIEILEFYEGEKYQDLCVQMFGIPYESASFTFSTNKTGEELMLLRMGTLWDGGSPK